MDWKSLEAAVDQTVAAHFDEPVRISFFTSGGTADPARPQWTGRGILLTGGDDSFAAGNGMRVRLSAGQAELVLNRTSYTGPDIRVKDKVRGLDRAGLPLWEVSTVSDRYSNLLVLSLNQA